MNKVVFIYLLSLSICCYCLPTEPLGKPAPPVSNDTAVAKSGTEAANNTTNTPKVPPATPPNQTTLNNTTEKDVATPAVAPQDNVTTKATPTLAPSVPTEAAKTEKLQPSSKPTAAPVAPTATPNNDTTTHKNDKPTEKPSNKTSTTPATHPDDKTEPAPLQARGFDGGSFVGGIVLTLGMLAIGFIGFKYYRSQTERNYHTL